MRIGLSRLRLLAQHLDKLEATPPEKRKREFVMGVWLERFSCGTAACALGEACFIPQLKAAGLRHSRFGSICGTAVPYIVRRGKKHSGTDAAMHLFGISHSDAHVFFMPRGSDNDTPGKVATLIRMYIASEKAAA